MPPSRTLPASVLLQGRGHAAEPDLAGICDNSGTISGGVTHRLESFL